MTGPAGFGAMFEFEAFGAAVGSALACGVLSTFVPWLISPTATLAALALAGWVSLSRRRGTLSWHGFDAMTTGALGVLGGVTVGFLDPPSSLVPVRGLLLAGGLVPLLAVERFRSRSGTPAFSHP
jgi:hypothetical protein